MTQRRDTGCDSIPGPAHTIHHPTHPHVYRLMPVAWTFWLLVSPLLSLLLAAVVTDLRSRRIPNTLVLLGICLALLAHALALVSDVAPLAGAQWWAPLAGLSVGLFALMPLYLLRALGAGDLKLLAMVGAFVGAPTVLIAALYTLLAGGVLSLVVMLGRGVATHTLRNLRFLMTDWALRMRSGHGIAMAPLATTAARLPYAVAISAGTVMALLQAP
jgi:prepilin peptidase CpaA